MKKENKKLAQELRAKERSKARNRKRIKMILAILLPIVLFVALIFGLAWANNVANEKEENESDTIYDSSYFEEDPSGDATENTKSEPVDDSREIAMGDTVNIDFVGYLDGVPFESGDSQGAGYDVVIGSHSLIDDFEEQLIGHCVGEQVEVNVTFPDDYKSADLAGKDAMFEVTINNIYE